MPVKKGGAKKGKRKNNKNKEEESILSQLLRGLNGILVLLIIVVSAGLIAHHMFPKVAPKKHTTPKHIEHKIKVKRPQPKYEVYPKEENSSKKESVSKQEKHQKPHVAIIIDDIGNDVNIAERFLNLNIELTLSILPHSPYSGKIVSVAKKKGCEVMLHLPMEPNEYPKINPGPGALLTSMSDNQIIRRLTQDLDLVPFLVGVNNHMGSRMTAHEDKLYQIFKILKKRNLFFIDSRTTVETKCRSVARLFKVPFAERDVFLDHDQSPESIRHQIERLIVVAKRKGKAIGIGHPHQSTYEVLSNAIKHLKLNLFFVPVSKLVTIVA